MRQYTMTEPIFSYCTFCHQRIKEKYFLVIGSKKMHSECLHCLSCGVSLSNAVSCCEKDDVIYCKECYYRLFPVTICMGCRNGISKHAVVMQANDYYYHIDCFRCSLCQIKLEPGQRFGLREKNLFCEIHINSSGILSTTGYNPANKDNTQMSFTSMDSGHRYITQQIQHTTQPSPNQIQVTNILEKVQAVVGIENSDKASEEVDMLPISNIDNEKSIDTLISEVSTSPIASSSSGDQEMSVIISSGNSETDDDNKQKSCKRNKKTKATRVRTKFTQDQLLLMKELFSVERNPDSAALNELSKQTNLTKRVLQVWFQNARAKTRKNENSSVENFERLINPSNDPS